MDERCAIRMTMADGRQAAWPIIFADVAAADQHLADVCQEKRHQDREKFASECWWKRAGVQLHSLRIEYIRVRP